MGGNNSNRNRFPLPDNWNVDEFICAVVPIPNDPQYIATFRGLLATLTWQRSFELHRTEDAAYQVSKTWEAAFASRQLSFLTCQGENVIFRYTEDCKLEVSDCDDPEVWRPVVTGQIDGEGGYDPRFDDSPEIPYPDAPPDGACIAAANATEAIKATADKISEAMDTSGPLALLLSGIMLIFQILITAVIDIINMGALLNVVSELDPETVRADYLAFDWQDLTDIIVCYYEDDGTMTHENYIALVNEIAAIIPGESSQMYTIAHWHLIQSGPKGMQRAATYAGITEAVCAPCGGWSHYFDFTIDAQGWSDPNDSENSEGGVYVAGEGWASKYPPQEGPAMQRFWTGEPTTVTQVVVHADGGLDGTSPRLYLRDAGTTSLLANEPTFGAATVTLEVALVDRENLRVVFDPWAGGGQGTSRKIIGLTLSGTGVEPDWS